MAFLKKILLIFFVTVFFVSSVNAYPCGLDGVGQVTNADPEITNMIAPAWTTTDGQYAYVAAYNGKSVSVIDITTDPETPAGVEEVLGGPLEDPLLPSMNTPWEIFILGNYAYVVSLFNASFDIINISNPLNLQGEGELTGIVFPSSVFVKEDGPDIWAYVTSLSGDRLYIVDVSDHANPSGVNSIIKGGVISAMDQPRSVFVTERGIKKYAFVASGFGDSLAVIDVTDETNLIAVDQVIRWTGGGPDQDIDIPDMDDPFSVFVQGDYAYVASCLGDSLAIIDISGLPVSIDGVGQITKNDDPLINQMDCPKSVFVQGDYAYVTGETGDSLALIYVKDKANPQAVAQVVGGNTAYVPKDPDILAMDGPRSVFVQGNYAYVASAGGDSLAAILINQCTGPLPVTPCGNGAIDPLEECEIGVDLLDAQCFSNQCYNCLCYEGYSQVEIATMKMTPKDTFISGTAPTTFETYINVLDLNRDEPHNIEVSISNALTGTPVAMISNTNDFASGLALPLLIDIGTFPSYTTTFEGLSAGSYKALITITKNADGIIAEEKEFFFTVISPKVTVAAVSEIHPFFVVLVALSALGLILRKK